MKNTFGTNLSLTIFGESHGPAVGAVIDGLCPGIKIDTEYIEKLLTLRRPVGNISTPRKEADRFDVLSGVFEGKTTGTPVCIVIPNENTKSDDYNEIRCKARPSHADFVAFSKYGGNEDFRGGGHFSGRVTAGIVAAGAILKSALEKKNIFIGSHILNCKNAQDREFIDAYLDIKKLKESDFPVLDESAEEDITKEILNAKQNLDSVGGTIETAVVGLPVGVGEPWFDSLEGVLSHALFSLGGVKGVEFGKGFDGYKLFGSEYNDALLYKDGKVVTKTNNNGGINGGISNGMPVIFKCAVKPTPSIAKPQETIDFIKQENTVLEIKGRHDPAIIRRICPCIESLTALVICDMLWVKFGTDYLRD
jgi:chorismate synthase